MYPFDKKPATPHAAVLKDLREGYPVEIAAASGDMLPEELTEARKADPEFDRECRIAENFGKRVGWDAVQATSTGAVRAFQRVELGSWANSAEAKPERRIEDFIA
jgi:hypothetical protein